MKTYPTTVNLKLGLIVFAVIIALASLLYANGLVDRLRERERASMEIWAGARKEVARSVVSNPFQKEFHTLTTALGARSGPDIDRMREALAWASRMPMGVHTNFFFALISEYYLDVPAIITDSLDMPVTWRNVGIPVEGPLTREDSLKVRARVQQMAEVYSPISIEVAPGDGYDGLQQWVYYDESGLIRELRIFPYVQLLFVGLLVLVGYMGFSYVRRSEQSNLWVGMAREAAHQLGTPLSSLMGWNELMRQSESADSATLDEVSHDLQRLSRVANRFNDIGSTPRLTSLPLAPSIVSTADYIRRRMPQHGVTLETDVPVELTAPLNTQLFEWVIENLLKNALDAMQDDMCRITLTARKEGRRIYVDCTDNGKGIDRRLRRDVFRPGYSTKKRGWGLGLSLAKRIIEDYHGGSLTLLHSAPGQGTTFRIELPAS